MRILIIEDNQRLAESVQDILKQSWYDSDICNDGVTGSYLMETGQYDAVILDIMLPGRDGLTVLRENRARGNLVPVLLLTAKGEVADRVYGLDSGADYYLTKPFDGQELLAVMKTIVRRRGAILPDCLTFGDLSLNQSTYCLSGPEKKIQLGKKEYEIIRILLVNKGQVVSKEVLLQKVWGNEREAVVNNVEIYISFLRKKLTFLKTNVSIVTMRNLGYCLAVGKH